MRLDYFSLKLQVGYDSWRLTAYCELALTSVKYPNEEIGRIAAEELFSMIKDPLNYQSRVIKVEPHIIIRDSVKKISSDQK